MSTKDTLVNLGLLAAGGVAIAAASGVYGKGSRAKASVTYRLIMQRKPDDISGYWSVEDVYPKDFTKLKDAIRMAERFAKNLSLIANDAWAYREAIYVVGADGEPGDKPVHVVNAIPASPYRGAPRVPAKGSRAKGVTRVQALISTLEEARRLVSDDKYGSAIGKLREVKGAWSRDPVVYDLLAEAIIVIDNESYGERPIGTGDRVLQRVADFLREER